MIFFEGIAHTLAEVCLQLFTSNDNVSYFSSLLELLSLIFQFNQGCVQLVNTDYKSTYNSHRVTSLEQLSVAEFSGE